MKSILLLFIVVAMTDEADVPSDCYRVEHESYEECYTFSNTVSSTQPSAERTCASSGGRLAIITDVRTWELLIDRFLKGFSDHVWLGYKVDSNTYTKLIPEMNLSNMTKYWSSNSMSSSYGGYCMYAQQNTWKWKFNICIGFNTAYFCQYNITCNVNDIQVPHLKSQRNAMFARNNETIDVECEIGYFLNSSSSNAIRCTTGKWEEVQCIPGCLPPGEKRNSILTSVKESYDIGETIYYVCKSGYLYSKKLNVTHFSTICQHDSTWSDSDANCGTRHPFSITNIDVKTSNNYGNILGRMGPFLTTIVYPKSFVNSNIVNGTSFADSGTSATDSGTSATDSGTTSTDSGTSPTDSGTSPTDSGNSSIDSGTSPTDSGTSPTDSGTSSIDSDSTKVVAELKCDLNATERHWFRNGKLLNNVNNSLVLRLRNDEDFAGFYICIGNVSNRLQLGRKAYDVMKYTVCPTSQQKTVEAKEGENVFLLCPQNSDNREVKWFKDDDEVFSSEHRNIIPNTGLFLSNVKLLDEGIYKCQITKTDNRLNCKQNVTQELSVTAIAESVCGTKSIATKTYQPWLAVLRQDDEMFPLCYGTLIASKWIVTSAFCLVPLDRKKVLQGFTVQFGSADKNQTFAVASVMIHPLYRARRNLYDIGLVELMNSPVKFSGTYLPACISPDDIGNIHKYEEIADLNGTVAGWGPLVDNVDENDLNVEEMSLVPKEICRNSKTTGFAEDKFCAQFGGEEATFAGDIGSPFLVNHNGRSYLLGIFTWGERETDTGMYDYFTGIYQYYDWITNITSINV